MRYFGIILLFAVGAGIGSMGAARLAGKTIWISCGLLPVSYTHLDVYKRQGWLRCQWSGANPPPKSSHLRGVEDK